MAKILLILDGESTLLSDGLLSMLDSLENTRHTTTLLRNNGTLLQEIQAHRPDVIVLFEDDHSECPSDLARILCVIDQRVRVLIVSREKNTALVFEKNQIPIHSSADFFAFIPTGSSQASIDLGKRP
jgi:hypothetical protein